MLTILNLTKGTLGTVNIVDDHQEQYRAVKSALRKIGYRVKFWKSVTEVRAKDVSRNSFWVVDRRFGKKNEPKGDDLVDKLLNIGDVRVVLLTAFSLPETLGQIAHNAKKNTFFVRLAKLSEEVIVFDAIPKYLDRFFRSDDLPAHMDLREFQEENKIRIFRELREKDQDAISDRVTTDYQDEVRSLWKKGALWVGIFGENRKAMKAVYSASEVPDEETIELLEDNYGLPCFEFDRTASFHNTVICGGNGRGGEHVGTYPALFFDNSESDESAGDRFGVHFDTGADLSLLCEKFAKTIESVSFGGRKKTVPLQTQLHRVRMVSAKLLLKVKKHGQIREGENPDMSKLVTVRGYSVNKWQESDFSMTCSGECSRGNVGNFCKLRSRGIIGRNFVDDNCVNLVIRHSGTEIEVSND